MSYTGSAAFNGIATLSRSTTSGGTYTAFAEIMKITTPKTSVAKVPVTNMSSTTVGGKEYRPDPLPEPGEYEFEANMTDADNVFVRSTIAAGTMLWFKMVFNNPVSTAGTTRAFKGFFTEISEENVDPQKYVTHKIKIAITGAETVTAAV